MLSPPHDTILLLHSVTQSPLLTPPINHFTHNFYPIQNKKNRMAKTGVTLSSRVSISTCCWVSALGACGYFAASYSIKRAVAVIKKDRFAAVRCHPWRWVRRLYQRLAIYHFAWKLDKAVRHLPPPVDAMEFHPDSESILDAILDEAERNNIHTYQKRPSNRLQISSLMNLVCGLVKEIETALTKRPDTDVTVPVVLDIGAGKALFTRGVFEALNGQVAAVALDSRKPCKTDQVYDPPPGSAYTRLVADVRSMTESTLAALKGNEEGESEGGVVAMTKHLCGGATDACLTALCVPPLASYIGACCFAPCCHQKTKRTQYCNLPFLEAQGFCNTHVGVRGQVQDVDWKNFRMLVSMSKGGLNAGITEGGEYKNSQMLQVLGRDRACKMGRQARRLLEEGRMQYLQDHGFDTVLVKYCDETVTGDNWAIIARKRSVLNSVHR